MTPKANASCDPPTPRERLDAIEAALRRYLADDDPPASEPLAELTRQVRAIAQAQRPPEGAPAEECLAAARRIRRLHDQLVLRLTQQRAEAAAQLAHLRKGKATLRAYGHNR